MGGLENRNTTKDLDSSAPEVKNFLVAAAYSLPNGREETSPDDHGAAACSEVDTVLHCVRVCVCVCACAGRQRDASLCCTVAAGQKLSDSFHVVKRPHVKTQANWLTEVPNRSTSSQLYQGGDVTPLCALKNNNHNKQGAAFVSVSRRNSQACCVSMSRLSVASPHALWLRSHSKGFQNRR